jgi:hypothetical protein
MGALLRDSGCGRFLFIFIQPALQVAERIAAKGEIVLDDPTRAVAVGIAVTALFRLFGSGLRRRDRNSPRGRLEIGARWRGPPRRDRLATICRRRDKRRSGGGFWSMPFTMMIGMSMRRRLRLTQRLHRNVGRFFEKGLSVGGARPAPPGIFPYEI